MPGRNEIVLVAGAPLDADNWLYRRFIDAGLGPEVTFIWPIGDGMADAVVKVADEEKLQRRDDGMRKQLESDRQHAKLDLPREITNRKARRAAAATRRKGR